MESGSLSSARTQLDLLDQLTSTISTIDGYESDGSSTRKLTIRDQLAQLVWDRDDDFSIPLGKNLKKISPTFLTTSQKRNIKRQAYLGEVSQRNDTVFFATIGAFVILPPLIILGI
ncbi:Toll-like receptor 8, partial [Actinidia chinensis var. chinensis]